MELRGRQSARPCLGHDLHLPARAGARGRGRPRLARAHLPQAAAELHLVGQPQGPRRTTTCSRAASSASTTSASSTGAPRCRPAATSSRPTGRRGWPCSARTCSRSRRSSRSTGRPTRAGREVRRALPVDRHLDDARRRPTRGCGTRRTASSTTSSACPTAAPSGSRSARWSACSRSAPSPPSTASSSSATRSSPSRCGPSSRPGPSCSAFIHDPAVLGVDGRRLAAILDETQAPTGPRDDARRDRSSSARTASARCRATTSSTPTSSTPAARSTGWPTCRRSRTAGCSAATRTGAGRSGCPSTRSSSGPCSSTTPSTGTSSRSSARRAPGPLMTLYQVAEEIERRLASIFLRDERRPAAGLRRVENVPGRPALARPASCSTSTSTATTGRSRRQPPDRLDGAHRPGPAPLRDRTAAPRDRAPRHRRSRIGRRDGGTATARARSDDRALTWPGRGTRRSTRSTPAPG